MLPEKNQNTERSFIMPFINTKTNVSISQEKELSIKQQLGQAISLIRGKSESWLMVNFEDNSRLYFAGDGKTPCAFVEIKLYGAASSQEYENLTEKITEIISSELNIQKTKIYIKYEETVYWGFAGHNF